jgi:hypothetical protein
MFTPRYFIDVRNSSSVPFRVYLYSMVFFLRLNVKEKLEKVKKRAVDLLHQTTIMNQAV